MPLVSTRPAPYIAFVTGNRRFSNDGFMTAVREYLTMEATTKQIDGPQNENALDRGLADNVFYEFDADSLVAIWHAVEDIALEEGNGSLLAAIQEFSWFELQRDRYEQLGLTLDRVELIGAGAAPRRAPHVRFLSDKRGAAKRFRGLVYSGSRVQVAFFAEQQNAAKDFDGRRFTGFYTFDERLITRLRADFLNLVAGRSDSFREFARQRAIYEAGWQIQREFAMQKDALAKAVRRLRLDGKHYRPGQFASDLEKGLSRLFAWKNKMPKLIEQIEGN